MSDLETRIRDALGADEIGWDDLRQPTLRAVPRSTRRWPTVLATAAAVAVVASVTVAIVLTRGNGSNEPAGPQHGYAGYEWQLTAVTDSHGHIADIASTPPRIAFGDNTVSGTLTRVSILGRYRPTSNGYDFTFLGLIGPTAATARESRSEQRIGADFGRVFFPPRGRNFDLSHPVRVIARVSGDQLVLQANGVTLRLSRVGPSQLSPIIDAFGYTWNFQAVTDQHGRLTIPHRSRATITFNFDGLVVGNDTVNSIGGMLRLTSDGYVIDGQVASSGVGYAGHDPIVLRQIAAVRAMVGGGGNVTATVDGDTLTLNRNGITVTLQRGRRERLAQSLVSGGQVSATSTAARSPHPATPPGGRRGTASVSRGHAGVGSHH